MKNKCEYSKEERVSVYQFMEMCGLRCTRKRNVLLSHKAMRKKLLRRFFEFSEAITIPVALPMNQVEKSEVVDGEVILVEDDYKNIIPYLRPQLLSYRPTILSDEEKQLVEDAISRNCAEEGLYINTIKPGELKYRIKQEKRAMLEEEKRIEAMLEEDRKEALAGFTEDQVKVRSKKIRYY